MKASFTKRLASAKCAVCVGMDPDPARMPACVYDAGDRIGSTFEFCRRIIEATAPWAAAYKFNFAFFEAMGADGWDVMRALRGCIPDATLTIADAKRGDIGNSAEFYAASVFEDLGFDAVTVSPYMGGDSVKPFLEYAGTCTFALARTSNPGGSELQTLLSEGVALFERVATLSREWAVDLPGEMGLVTGASDLSALARLRTLCPEMPFLIPGVGAQGGDVPAVVEAAGSGPMLVNSSRAILYASSEEDFETAAAEATASLWKQLQS